MNDMKPIRFDNTGNEFWYTLKSRVDAYFAEKKRSKFAGPKTYAKMFFMLAAFLVPYFLLILTPIPVALALTLCVVMGFAMAGIGFSISHPAVHNAISSRPWVNRMFGFSFNMLGMSDYMWKIKHNVFHHSYTNVYEVDEALREGELMRMSYDAPLKPFHKYQHVYGFLIYALFTVFWVFLLDFEKLKRYNGNGSRKAEKHPPLELFIFWTTKIYYVFFALIIPHYVAGYSWPAVITGFLIVHIIASLLITHVLQVEHIAEETILVDLPENGLVKKSWAENQLEGTCNFRAGNGLFEWYVAACNYQIEHHLFPLVSPEHFPALSKIVRQTAAEYNLQYQLQPSIGKAVVSHYRMLRNLGRNQSLHTATA